MFHVHRRVGMKKKKKKKNKKKKMVMMMMMMAMMMMIKKKKKKKKKGKKKKKKMVMMAMIKKKKKKMEQSVPKRWHTKFRRRGISQKKAYVRTAFKTRRKFEIKKAQVVLKSYKNNGYCKRRPPYISENISLNSS